MNKWSFFILLLVAYLPFQMALNLSPDIDLLSGRVLILGFFGLWLLRQVSRGPKRLFSLFAASRSAWGLAAFFIISAASILAAVNHIWGLRKLLVFVSVFPLYFLIQALIKNDENRGKLLYVVIGGAAVSAGIALAQFLSQFIFGLDAVMNFWAAHVVPLFSGATFGNLVASNPSWLVNVGGQTTMRAIGLFPDPHMLAFYLGLTAPFSFTLFLLEKRYRFLLFIVNCLLLTVLLLTFSRGGYLGLLAALAIIGVGGWRRFSRAAKKFFGSGLLLAAVIFLLVGWPVITRLTSSFDLSEGSNLGRLAIWRESWAIIKSSPMIGVGLGNYPAAADFSGAYRSAVTSHNLYLDIWAETGILGLAAWLALVFSAAKAAYRRLARDRAVSLAALASLAYFSVHAFFETPIFNPTVLAFLMIVLALPSVMDIKKDVL